MPNLTLNIRKLSLLLSVILSTVPTNAYCQGWQVVGATSVSDSATEQNSFAIDRNGTPYVCYSAWSSDRKITVKKFDGSNWVLVGDQSQLGMNGGSIAINDAGNPYLAYRDGYQGKATVMKYNGTDWLAVGNRQFSPASNPAYGLSIAVDHADVPYVVYTTAFGTQATGPVIAMKYDGASWLTAGGTAGDTNSTNSIVLDPAGTPYVAYQHSGTSLTATVLKMATSGTTTVGGAGFAASWSDAPAIAVDPDGNVYATYIDPASAGDIVVKKYNGSSWVTVGAFPPGQAFYPTIAIDVWGTPYVAYASLADSQKITVVRYNGTSWTTVGNASFTAATARQPILRIDNNGTPYVAYIDGTDDAKIKVMKYGWPAGVAHTAAQHSCSLSLYPNPGTGAFTLHILTPQNEDATVKVYNMAGLQITWFRAATNVNIPLLLDVSPGLYIISAITQSGELTATVCVK